MALRTIKPAIGPVRQFAVLVAVLFGREVSAGEHDWDDPAKMGGPNDLCTSENAAFNLLGRWDEATPVFASDFTFDSAPGTGESGQLSGSDTVTSVKLEIYSWAATSSRIICGGAWLLRPTGGIYEWSDNYSNCVTWGTTAGIYTSYEGDADGWGLSQLTANDLINSSFGVYFLAENIYTQSGGQDIQCSVGSIKLTVTAGSNTIVRYPKSVGHAY